jgi:ATP-dependent Clp protease ATP-binding subunit ClpC
VGTEHLLLGLLREHDGVAAQVLMNLGLRLDEVREEVLNLLGAGASPEAEAPEDEGGVPNGGGPATQKASVPRARPRPSTASVAT